MNYVFFFNKEKFIDKPTLLNTFSALQLKWTKHYNRFYNKISFIDNNDTFIKNIKFEKLISFLLNKIPRPMLINLSIFLPLLIYLFFQRNNFTDPIDGKSYQKFLPYGYGKQRENALSPEL